jgi:hypothetical protein
MLCGKGKIKRKKGTKYLTIIVYTSLSVFEKKRKIEKKTFFRSTMKLFLEKKIVKDRVGW